MRRPSSRAVIVSLLVCALGVVVTRGLHLWGPSERIALCGTGFEARVPGRPLCPDGHQVRRELLLPVSLAPPGSRFQSAWVTLPVLVTVDGPDHSVRRMWLTRPYVQSDDVALHAGWIGRFGHDLDRLIGLHMPAEKPPNGPPSGIPAWNDDIDPDFRVMDGRSSWTARRTGMRPLLFVPKSGDQIFFLCWDKVSRRPEDTFDIPCDVRDMASGTSDPDQLVYQLYRSRIRDWRRYSGLLWALIDSFTIPPSPSQR